LAVIIFYIHNILKSSSSKGSSHLTKWGEGDMAGIKQVANHITLIHQEACHYHGRPHGTKSSHTK